MPGEDFASIEFPFRFKVVNVVPVAAVLLTVGTVVLSGAPGHAPQRQALFDNAREFGWTGAVAVLAATVVIALLAEPLELASIRFLEGYWPMTGPLRRVRAAGLRAQRRRHSRLRFLATKAADEAVKDHAGAQLAEQFPEMPDRVLPTSLGNRLRAFEERAGKGYGVDAIQWWPRLHHALPEPARSTVDRHRDQLDVASRLTIAWAVGTVALIALLAPHPAWWWLPALTAVLSWFAYRGALGAAGVYGTAVTAAIDVYRLHLLQEMRVELPADTVAERDLNDRLLILWAGYTTVSVDYQTTDSDHHLQIT